ncbi:MAG: hypothetical protein E5X11_16880, partial [Mesorhizobium sp.]
MGQPKQLRDWNPAAGSPTSGLSERRDFHSQDTPLDGRKKHTGVPKMKKIVLTAAALLAISGSAFAG